MSRTLPPLLTEHPEWQALAAHAQQLRGVHLRTLFADDPHRGEQLTAEAAGIYLDYSKNRLTGETIRLLVALAEGCGLRDRIEAMFRGEPINVTEHRPVLHVALRAPREATILVNGENVVPQVHAVLDRMGDQGTPGGVARLHWQADPGGGEPRHRGLGPRTSDGLRSLALV